LVISFDLDCLRERFVPHEEFGMNDWAEFRHFRYLLEIVRHAGFRAAAEALHTAQPNLSAQAKQFQEHSHVHLYRRIRDGRIELTDVGIAFRAIAEGLLDARDEAIAALVAIALTCVCGLNVKLKLAPHPYPSQTITNEPLFIRRRSFSPRRAAMSPKHSVSHAKAKNRFQSKT
jgi:hypothetical protein